MKRIFTRVIREMIVDAKCEGKKLTQNDFAKALGTSQQNFSNKMIRDTFSIEDALKIADYFGMELIIREKGNKKIEYVIKKGN